MIAYAPKQGKPVVQGVMTYPEQIARCGAAEGLTAHSAKWGESLVDIWGNPGYSVGGATSNGRRLAPILRG